MIIQYTYIPCEPFFSTLGLGRIGYPAELSGMPCRMIRLFVDNLALPDIWPNPNLDDKGMIKSEGEGKRWGSQANKSKTQK